MNKIFYSMFIFALGSKELAMNGKQGTRYEIFLSTLAKLYHAFAKSAEDLFGVKLRILFK